MTYVHTRFERLSEWISAAMDRPMAFLLAFATVLFWAVSGPVFHFSDTWQLVINTGTTITTFLMVFLLQNTGNRTIAELQGHLHRLEHQNAEILTLLREPRLRVA